MSTAHFTLSPMKNLQYVDIIIFQDDVHVYYGGILPLQRAKDLLLLHILSNNNKGRISKFHQI